MEENIFVLYKIKKHLFIRKNSNFSLKMTLFLILIGSISIRTTSEIHLVFSVGEDGYQNIINTDFEINISEVWVNGAKKDDCDKTCYLEKGLNNVTIKFDDQLETCRNMFNNLGNLKEIDLSYFDTSKVKDMNSMFYDCKNLEKINLGNIDTSSVEDMSKLFENCHNLESIDLSRINTPKLKITESMFNRCYKLPIIDLSHLDFSKVTNMIWMFNDCTNLETINFGNIDTSSLETMESIFQGCTKIQSIDISKFNTSKVNNMKCMFNYCLNLKTINLGNIDTSFVEDMSKLFENCHNLESIDLSRINTPKLKITESMFNRCYKLPIIDLSHLDFSKVTNMIWMFNDCTNLETINFGNIDTSSLETMESIFQGCTKIQSIDISKFNTSKVNNMKGMFNYGLNLKSINFGNINTSSVNYMNEMFRNCKQFTSIDLSNWDFSKVESMELMFYNCTNLENINFGNINTSSLESISATFDSCSSLKSIDLSNFDTSKIKYMESTFKDCVNLMYLNLSHFQTSEITTMKQMFYNCKSMIFINLESFQIIKSIEKENIFYELPTDVKFCIKDNYTKTYLLGSERISDCENDCFILNDPKFDIHNKMCLNSCLNSNNYKFEYKGICYDKCPNGTLLTDSVCLEKDDFNPEQYGCSEEEHMSIKCSMKETQNNTEIYNIIINNILSTFTGENGKNIILEGHEETIFQITNTKNELELLKSNNISNDYNLSIIDLAECEILLKEEYNINKEDSLIFIKQEKLEDKASEKDIQYECYEPYNKTKLNLSICSGVNINLYVPLKLSGETKNTAEEMKESGYNMFDINDKFYQDICSPYKSSVDSDILLSDRIDYIYNNEDSQCQDNCEFTNYFLGSRYINCTCLVEQDNRNENKEEKIDKFEAKTVYEMFYNVLKYSNYEVFKCFKLVFDKSALTKNIGSILIIVSFLLYLSCLLLYIIKGISPLKNKVKDFNEEKDKNQNLYFPPSKKKRVSFKSKTKNLKENSSKIIKGRKSDNIINNKKKQITESQLVIFNKNIKKESNSKNYLDKKGSRFVSNEDIMITS